MITLDLEADSKPTGAWRSESILVLRADAPLPDVCFRCGRPSLGNRLRRRVSWHPPGLYVLVLFPLIYILAALGSRRTASLSLPFCARHRRLRTLSLVGAWILLPLGLVGAMYGLTLEMLAVALLGLYAALAGLLVASLGASAGTTVEIDPHFVRMRGAHPALLDALPDWNAFPEIRA